MVPPRYGHQRQAGGRSIGEMGIRAGHGGHLIAGDWKRMDGKERQRLAAEREIMSLRRSRGPVHWQLHMGCGKKMGSITFIHHSLASDCLRSPGVGGGNKKSGEIKPDG